MALAACDNSWNASSVAKKTVLVPEGSCYGQFETVFPSPAVLKHADHCIRSGPRGFLEAVRGRSSTLGEKSLMSVRLADLSE